MCTTEKKLDILRVKVQYLLTTHLTAHEKQLVDLLYGVLRLFDSGNHESLTDVVRALLEREQLVEAWQLMRERNETTFAVPEVCKEWAEQLMDNFAPSFLLDD